MDFEWTLFTKYLYHWTPATNHLLFLNRMFFSLPEEIRLKIYSYDSTVKEMFDRVIHQIKFIPVIGQFFWKARRDGDWMSKQHFEDFQRVRPKWYRWSIERPLYVQNLAMMSWNNYWRFRFGKSCDVVLAQLMGL